MAASLVEACAAYPEPSRRRLEAHAHALRRRRPLGRLLERLGRSVGFFASIIELRRARLSLAQYGVEEWTNVDDSRRGRRTTWLDVRLELIDPARSAGMTEVELERNPPHAPSGVGIREPVQLELAERLAKCRGGPRHAALDILSDRQRLEQADPVVRDEEDLPVDVRRLGQTQARDSDGYLLRLLHLRAQALGS